MEEKIKTNGRYRYNFSEWDCPESFFIKVIVWVFFHRIVLSANKGAGHAALLKNAHCRGAGVPPRSLAPFRKF